MQNNAGINPNTLNDIPEGFLKDVDAQATDERPVARKQNISDSLFIMLILLMFYSN